MRILVIRRDNIGDLACTTPLLAALRARYPQAHIAALVNSYNAAVLDGNPHLDAVHVYTKLKHRRPGESRLGILFSRLRMLAHLRRSPYDYVLLAKGEFDRQGLGLARQLRRRHVVGFARAGEAAPGITLPVAAPGPGLHEVEIMQRLAEQLDAREPPGPVRVYPRAECVEAWRARISGPRIAVHVSAREANRRWPAERWIELIERLNAGVVLVWAPGASSDPRHPGDDELAAAILRQARGTLAAPTPALADLIAVLSLCDGFIGADGGAMHLAAALGLPTVAFFENDAPKIQRWRPWQVPHAIVTPPAREVLELGVEEVAAAWRRLSGTTTMGTRTEHARSHRR
jgi:heptosyltransferase III